MTLDEDDSRIAADQLRNISSWKNQGPVAEYETQFARWSGLQFAFAFASGREALSACISALGLLPGDEVILPGYTCVVVPNAFHYAGIKTVYSDIELDTYGLDGSKIEEKITPNTRAVLLHHMYGLVSRDYEQILALAKRRHLKVIEDCAQATGSEYKGLKSGCRGDVAFYSSEQSKILNTIQGGMAGTGDANIAQRINDLRDQMSDPNPDWVKMLLQCVILNYHRFKHPQRWITGPLARFRYGRKEMVSTTPEEEKGVRPSYYGRKMASPVAVLGLNQLKKIDRYNEIRRQQAKRWDEWCESRKYKKPVVLKDSVPVYLRYPVLVEPDKKRNTAWATKELGVEVGVWFIGHIHPTDRSVTNCPNADRAVQQCINLPTLGA